MENTKAIDELYVPHRLPGETLSQYHWRQKVQKMAAKQGTLLRGHKATPQKVNRGKLIEQLGARQARKTLKLIKRVQKVQLAGVA